MDKKAKENENVAEGQTDGHDGPYSAFIYIYADVQRRIENYSDTFVFLLSELRKFQDGEEFELKIKTGQINFN